MAAHAAAEAVVKMCLVKMCLVTMHPNLTSIISATPDLGSGVQARGAPSYNVFGGCFDDKP